MVPNPLVGFFQNCNPRVNFTTMLLKTVPILLGVAMIIVIVQLCGASTIVQSKNRFIDDPLADEERTFLMIKPDGVERGLVSEVIKRFEQKGFKLVGIKVKVPDQELLKQHYAEHALKPFFGSMIEYMSMGPVVPMVSIFLASRGCFFVSKIPKEMSLRCKNFLGIVSSLKTVPLGLGRIECCECDS